MPVRLKLVANMTRPTSCQGTLHDRMNVRPTFHMCYADGSVNISEQQESHSCCDGLGNDQITALMQPTAKQTVYVAYSKERQTCVIAVLPQNDTL